MTEQPQDAGGTPPKKGAKMKVKAGPDLGKAAIKAGPDLGNAEPMKFGVPEKYFKAKEILLKKIGGLSKAIEARHQAEKSKPAKLGLENICGVGIGKKVVEGKQTDELAVIVMVLQKETDKAALADPALIDSFIDVDGEKIPTDIAVIDPVAPMNVYTSPENPAQSGAMIGREGAAMVGTIGCLVQVITDDPNDPTLAGILSNTHVMAMGPGNTFAKSGKTLVQETGDPNAANQAVRIFQPRPGAAGAQSIGRLWDYPRLSVSNSNSTDLPSSDVDAAIAWTDPPGAAGARVSPKHHTYELSPEPDVPTVKLNVMKEGFKTGNRVGEIVQVGVDLVVGYSETQPGQAPFAHFLNTVVIKTTDGRVFSEPGDSGSLVVAASSRRPVALLMAGNGTFSFANPIQDVIKALKIIKFYNTSNMDS